MNFSCYQGNGKSSGSASRREDRQTDRQRSCTAAGPRIQPSLALVAPSLPEGFFASLSCPHHTGCVKHPPSYIPVLTPVSPRLEPHPEGSIPHPRPFHCLSHILTCLILQPIAYIPHPSIPLPIFHTLYLAPHLQPGPGLAPYPAERQLDNVGSVAGDYPWEEKEEEEENQKKWSQSAPRSLDACVLPQKKGDERVVAGCPPPSIPCPGECGAVGGTRGSRRGPQHPQSYHCRRGCARGSSLSICFLISR